MVDLILTRCVVCYGVQVGENTNPRSQIIYEAVVSLEKSGNFRYCPYSSVQFTRFTLYVNLYTENRMLITQSTWYERITALPPCRSQQMDQGYDKRIGDSPQAPALGFVAKITSPNFSLSRSLYGGYVSLIFWMKLSTWSSATRETVQPPQPAPEIENRYQR